MPIITLLTDFGTTDHYVAAMKGVILGICPEVRLIDITHEIEPYAIAEAAFTLSQAWKCFPPGSIHLVVVDPGVGSSRRPILVESEGHLFVGPDNGVFEMANSLVRSIQVRAIENDRYFHHPVSQTFHGRDIFAPVAAHLASGIPPAEFGPEITDWVRLFRSAGIVLKIDRFGNIITDIPAQAIENKTTIHIEAGSAVITEVAPSYSDAPPNTLFAIAGSSGFVEISINQGNAARQILVKSGDRVRLQTIGNIA
jgi:S-adenosylmethionine hydrolase